MIMKFEMPKIDIYSFNVNENIAADLGDKEEIGGAIFDSTIF